MVFWKSIDVGLGAIFLYATAHDTPRFVGNHCATVSDSQKEVDRNTSIQEGVVWFWKYSSLPSVHNLYCHVLYIARFYFVG